MQMGVRTVVKFAIFTRVLALLLQAVLNVIIPDHEADAFSPPREEEPLLLDGAVEVLLGGLSRWDAEHFLFIAERGYLYEHNFAFFPLLPLALRVLADTLLWPLRSWLTVRGRLLVAVTLGNSLVFLMSAVALYQLGRLVLQDRRLSLVSSLLYCLTPANVFMMAGYSESLFAALTFGGLWLLEMGRTPGACLALGLATAARANGLANAGFLLYLPLVSSLSQVTAVRERATGRTRWLGYAGVTVRYLCTALLGTAVIVLPFCLFQYYGYRTFCTPTLSLEQISPALLSLAGEKGYRVPDAALPLPHWCQRPFPLLYSHIQDAYWNVGFLRYFQLRQLPNFLLALPVAVLGAVAVSLYAAASPAWCLSLGLRAGGAGGRPEKPTAGFCNPRAFVYVAHATVLLAFGVFCMHVQVLTRFLASSSPVLYWISAHLLQQNEPQLGLSGTPSPSEAHQQQMGSDSDAPRTTWRCLPINPITQLLLYWRTCSLCTHVIMGYYISYWTLGLALHCNFLPWT